MCVYYYFPNLMYYITRIAFKKLETAGLVRNSIIFFGGYLGDFIFISHDIYQTGGKRDVLGLCCLISKGSSESGT